MILFYLPSKYNAIRRVWTASAINELSTHDTQWQSDTGRLEDVVSRVYHQIQGHVDNINRQMCCSMEDKCKLANGLKRSRDSRYLTDFSSD